LCAAESPPGHDQLVTRSELRALPGLLFDEKPKTDAMTYAGDYSTTHDTNPSHRGRQGLLSPGSISLAIEFSEKTPWRPHEKRPRLEDEDPSYMDLYIRR